MVYLVARMTARWRAKHTHLLDSLRRVEGRACEEMGMGREGREERAESRGDGRE